MLWSLLGPRQENVIEVRQSISTAVTDGIPTGATAQANSQSALFRPHSFRTMGSLLPPKWRSRTMLGVVCALTLLATFTFYSRLNLNVFRRVILNLDGSGISVDDLDEGFGNQEYVIKTSGCRIERADPWDPGSRRYFSRVAPLKCSQEAKETLVTLENGILRVDPRAKKTLVVKEMSRKGAAAGSHGQFYCRLWTVYRRQVESDDDSYRLSDNFTEFSWSVPMWDEFAKVMCFVNSTSVYHNYFFNMRPKEELERASQERERAFLERRPQCDAASRLSVLIIGVDSVSKANFFRQFPLTYNLLLGDLSAVEFLGYNKVGLNTFPCLMPYMMGQSVDELREGCWGGGQNRFDNCTTLFDQFEAGGYRTAFVENLDQYGLFTYNRAGFKRRMAHYYGRTMYLPVMKNVKNFAAGCWRGRTDDQMLMDWAYQFQRSMHWRPHFGHFWMSRLCHDDINTAQQLDPMLSGYVKRMADENLLNNTLLIVMSDHGIRFGDFRETETGRVEENLPFMFFMFPDWFRLRYPLAMRRLRYNRHRLVTTFDLHRTLLSILECDYNDETFMSRENAERQRGISLFRKVSSNRTCTDADIPPIYCACREDVKHEDVKSETSKMFANLLIDQLNNLTRAQRELCVEFSLKEILSVRKVVASEVTAKNNTNATIRNSHIVALVTQPGGAKFEATIQIVVSNSTYVVNNDIRRINRYGETSACIHNDGFLKSICYCKNQ